MSKQSYLVPLGAMFLATTTLLSAQSAFNGTWKVDMNNVDFSKKPDVYLLQNGMYSCKTCVPAYAIKADGTPQAVTGHPYVDQIAIKAVGDREVQEVDYKAGKVVAKSDTTISPDGKTMTFTFTDSSNTNGGPPVTGKGEETLVTKGPAGSNPISGSWQMAKMESISDNGIHWSYAISGDSITMKSATGQSYTAKLDGTDAPMSGDPGVTSVSVKLLGKNTLEETDKRKGKVIGVLKLTLNPDGKSGKAVYEDMLQHRTSHYAVVKQ
jgi:Cu/Ag efflux protein CusF